MGMRTQVALTLVRCDVRFIATGSDNTLPCVVVTSLIVIIFNELQALAVYPSLPPLQSGWIFFSLGLINVMIRGEFEMIAFCSKHKYPRIRI